MKDGSIIVGLDIGTSKITTVIGEVAANGSVDIIGEGTVASEGISRGSVVNLERATHAIRRSIEMAQRVSGVPVGSVFVSVSGQHVKAVTSNGLAAIRRNQEINQSDVDRAIENARTVHIDPHLEMLHILPLEYVVDGQEGIKSAVGMHGVRLEVDVHIVGGNAGPLLNLRRCVQEAGVNVDGFVLQVLAAGLATLEATEQASTVLVVNMGSSSTDVGVFKRGNLCYSTSIPFGGDQISSDLSQLFKLPMEEAEQFKVRYGAAVPELAEKDLTLEITKSTGETQEVTSYEVARIIKPRQAEIYGFVREAIESHLGPLELVAQSAVITGGGAHLRGALELAREVFNLPVRVGRPRGIGGLSDLVAKPEFAVAVGALLYGIRQDGKVPLSVFESFDPEPPRRAPNSRMDNGLLAPTEPQIQGQEQTAQSAFSDFQPPSFASQSSSLSQQQQGMSSGMHQGLGLQQPQLSQQQRMARRSSAPSQQQAQQQLAQQAQQQLVQQQLAQQQLAQQAQQQLARQQLAQQHLAQQQLDQQHLAQQQHSAQAPQTMPPQQQRRGIPLADLQVPVPQQISQHPQSQHPHPQQHPQPSVTTLEPSPPSVVVEETNSDKKKGNIGDTIKHWFKDWF